MSVTRVVKDTSSSYNKNSGFTNSHVIFMEFHFHTKLFADCLENTKFFPILDLVITQY
jgi:hypothetical protein